jgi:hypothetical protein
MKANLDWKNKTLTLWKQDKRITVPVQLTRSLEIESSEEDSDSEEFDSDDEYESEELDETNIYFSDFADE